MAFEIIRKKDMFCTETALSTICNYYSAPYQMLFCHTWGFDYDDNGPCVGKNIKIGNWNYYDIMGQLGIKQEKIDDAAVEDIEALCRRLKKEKIAIVIMDMTIVNETNGTSYVGQESPYLFHDYDNEFIAYDLHYTHENVGISEELFRAACKKIRFYSSSGADFEFKYDLQELQKTLVPNKPEFEKIEFLALLFEKGAVDLKYETRDLAEGENPIDAPLIENIESLARGRNMFSMYLDYVNSMIPEIDLADECRNMSYWAGKWNLVKVILIKSYFKKDFRQDIMKKIAGIIDDIAKGERELYEQLLNAGCDGNKKVNSRMIKNEEKISKKRIDPVFLDLSKLYNNAGILLTGSEKHADMTGVGAYIEYEQEQLVTAASKHEDFYHLCEIARKPLDNILCQGQKIEIPKGIYNRINLLGCSDYGSFSDYMTIDYEGGGEKKFIQFSSWLNKQPLFDDQVYCTGRLIEINVRLHQSAGTLFTQSIELSGHKIHSIRLPNCPTMHIFSIYLN